NTADGFEALRTNTTGISNTATGLNALIHNSTGNGNAALGVQALGNNTTGQTNIGIGFQGGMNLTIGSNNIEIGNAGLAGETHAIRIGKQGTQTQTYVAGISGVPISAGVDVVINSSGRLGVGLISSARFKRDIRDMGAASDSLTKLRPVTF